MLREQLTDVHQIRAFLVSSSSSISLSLSAYLRTDSLSLSLSTLLAALLFRSRHRRFLLFSSSLAFVRGFRCRSRHGRSRRRVKNERSLSSSEDDVLEDAWKRLT